MNRSLYPDTSYMRSLPLFILATVLCASCSLQSPSQTQLHIEIPHSANLTKGSIHSLASTATNYQTTPESLADFDCFAVNVTATDMPPSNPGQCTLASDQIGVPGGWVPKQATSTSTAIDLMVPSGPNRLIQIYGVRTPDFCPRLGDFSTARLGDVYLLGSVTQDIFNDTSVSIVAALDTTKKALTSCQSSASTLADVTYYVPGPTPSPVTLDVPQNTQYSLTSVSTTSRGNSTVTDDGTHLKFSYNPQMNTGIDTYTYSVKDASGNTATGKIIIKNVTPYTWTGEAGDGKWSTAGNWCGGVNAAHSACTNSAATPPATADKAIFDGTCLTANCSASIDVTSTTITALFLDQDYAGTVTQAAVNTSFQVSNSLQIKGGTLITNSVTNSFYAPNALIVSGGSLIGGGGSMSLGIGSGGVTISGGLLDLSASTSVSLGSVSISGGTLHAPENGGLTYNGSITYSGGTINSGSTSSASSMILNGGASALTISAVSPITFQNLGLYSNSSSGGFTVNGTLNVLSTLNLNGMASGSAPVLNSGTINASGDIMVNSGASGYTGSTTVLLNGSITQTISDSSGAAYPAISVNKSGTLNINATGAITLQSLTANTVNHVGSGALTLPSGTISPGTFTQSSSGAVTIPAGTINGNFTIQSGTCSMTGNSSISGTLTLAAGTTLNKNSHTLTYGTLSNSGTINP